MNALLAERPHRPRLPPALARRIDRAARAAHAFHRFAHHPLCDRYAGELVPLGRRARLCRGCLALGLGVVLGLFAGVAARPSPWFLLAPVAAAVLAVAGSARRAPKAITRFAPGLLLGVAACSGVLGLLAATLASVVLWRLYARRQPDRSPCSSCPERHASVCPGFRLQVRRERAFQRLARRWMRPASQRDATAKPSALAPSASRAS